MCGHFTGLESAQFNCKIAAIKYSTLHHKTFDALSITVDTEVATSVSSWEAFLHPRSLRLGTILYKLVGTCVACSFFPRTAKPLHQKVGMLSKTKASTKRGICLSFQEFAYYFPPLSQKLKIGNKKLGHTPTLVFRVRDCKSEQLSYNPR